jgi:hypothetical protein
MRIIHGSRMHRYVGRVGIFLIMVVLIAGMAGCSLFPPQNVEIRTWYDLDAIRKNLGGHYILMNDLNSTTEGYEELASPTANEGKGWHPIIGAGQTPFTGTLDGQGHEIRDLFIYLPGIGGVGLFSIVGEGGRIEHIGVVNANVNSTAYIGSLVGYNQGTVSNSYSTGNVTGIWIAGGLVGASDGTVSNSYSTSNVTSDQFVGGLAGGNSGTVINSYATGSVTGKEGAGGLLGTNNGTVSNSFWDIETSGQATSSGGTGKNTTEMQDIATFSGATWNIITVANPDIRNLAYIWNIVDNETYPFLSWQPA